MKKMKRILMIFLVVISVFYSCDTEIIETVPASAIVNNTTSSNSNATFTTLQIQGTINPGTVALISQGVCWNSTGNPTVADTKTMETSSTFTSTIPDLMANTTYSFKIYATTSTGTYYGEEFQLSTLDFTGTTWDIIFIHDETTSWHADVEFKADGTTIYDEPTEPGVYTTYGTWKITGNDLYYDMDASDLTNSSYILNGKINGKTMSGTYNFGTSTKNWTAVLK